jgi:hypothetical protein
VTKVLSGVEQRPRVINEAIRKIQEDSNSYVTLTGAQTLTNKTLTSPVLTTPQINDTSADHQYVFAVSELAADRTVTLPLLGASDTFVFAAFSQALTNKDISSATNTYRAASESATGAVELATTTEASTGTDTSRAVTAAGLTAFTQTWGHAPNVIIEDQKAQNTSGGTATSGSWETRTLNTLVRNNGSLASLSSNQFTLPAGTFYISWSVPGYACGRHQTRLQNITDASTAIVGTSEFANARGVRGDHSRLQSF